MAEELRVYGPYPLWTIVIRRPKPPEAAVLRTTSMTPDPRKPTVQAPEMVVWARIKLLTQHPDGSHFSDEEVKELFRQIVAESRPDLPNDCVFDLEQGIDEFWNVKSGVPKITDRCPNHPDQRDNFCRHCGRKLGLSLKAT